GFWSYQRQAPCITYIVLHLTVKCALNRWGGGSRRSRCETAVFWCFYCRPRWQHCFSTKPAAGSRPMAEQVPSLLSIHSPSTDCSKDCHLPVERGTRLHFLFT